MVTVHQGQLLLGLNRFWAVLIVLLFPLAWPAQVRAAPLAQEEWLESSAGQFTFLYPPPYAADVRAFIAQQGQTFNDFYAEFTQLYGEPLEPPITVRIYSNVTQFTRLNALAPRLGEEAFHAHIGAREIALVAPLPEDFFSSGATALNVIRHELNGLFLSLLSADGLPPGLEVGFNQYIEIPGPQTQAARDKINAALANGQLLPWSELLDGPWVYFDREIAYPQSLSVAAFLVDRYGFGKWIEFVRAVADASGWRSALSQVYGQPLDRLELDWLNYLPQYVESRWRVNALFNYDLEPFAQALNAGAYTQVLRGLDYVLPFLIATGQQEKAAQAEALYVFAQQGAAANELLKATRDAVQNGDYALALELAEQARAAYTPLQDTARLEELDLYEARARELMDLRAQLDSASQRAAAGQLDEAESQLLILAPRLQALGDSNGAQSAEALLADLRTRRTAHARWATALVFILALFIAGHRVYELMQRRNRRPARIL